MNSEKASHTLETALEPAIIAPGQHPITEQLIDKDALLVLRKLNNSGFSSYLVGGGVRDLYLGKTPKDFDISTDARPGQLRKMFPNSRTIGRRFRLVQIFFKQGKIIEVATLRSLSEHDLDGPEAVLAPNNTYGSLDQDAQRRDLTINSLFYEIENNTILDYVGGVTDLDAGIIRIVGDPDKRIKRDPVRMLRAIRHASRINFAIEKTSWQAICANHQTLTLCPPSRLRDELLKDLYSGQARVWFDKASESGLFLQLFQIYNKIFYSEKIYNDQSIVDQIEKILTTIDRTNNFLVTNYLSRPKDFFILALLLLPWAEHTFNILSVRAIGADRVHLSKNLRQAIDRDIAIPLNLRKSLRQELVTLLMNLPSLIYHKKRGSWPKWLKKKSYFQKCSLFYHLYNEAYHGRKIPDIILTSKSRPKMNESKKNVYKNRSKRKPSNYKKRQ